MIRITLFFVLFSFITSGERAAAQQISAAEVQVNGLTCSMCSKATQTSLESLDFVREVSPDLNRNVFVLAFKAGQPVDIDQIRDKVQDAGFSIGELSATINFKQTAVDESGLVRLDGQVFQVVNARAKTLDGPVTAQVLDKDFITSSAYKKHSAELKSAAYTTGKGIVDGKETRIFHLSI